MMHQTRWACTLSVQTLVLLAIVGIESPVSGDELARAKASA